MKMIIAITKGFIRDQAMRRQAMFVLVIVALVTLFAGATFLNAWLISSPVLFILYWIACGWVTLAAVLLAFLDMLLLRLKLRHEQRALHKTIFGDKEKTPPDV